MFYTKLCFTGINISGIRYEDIMKDPHRSMTRIFKHLKLTTYYPKAIERILSRDSQRNTPVSRTNLGRFPTIELTDDVKRTTDIVCDYFKVDL